MLRFSPVANCEQRWRKVESRRVPDIEMLETTVALNTSLGLGTPTKSSPQHCAHSGPLTRLQTPLLWSEGWCVRVTFGYSYNGRGVDIHRGLTGESLMAGRRQRSATRSITAACLKWHAKTIDDGEKESRSKGQRTRHDAGERRGNRAGGK
ncbi:hypothetical protein GALMADRAFT_232282 [Galerina marginata CBS 339.88]|uniref:Uncharacterized protein n=1 Tax=Galerina marginata (strain CBS 339.88) TaxID=685588 RepID=A0A067SGL2_GALM3|nr:hypothetical protein GALMADRAFT_232282 [Galerina marginata CBS 339.88]